MFSSSRFKNFVASAFTFLHRGGSDELQDKIAYDGVSHHALGGGSYAYKDNYVGHLAQLLDNAKSEEFKIDGLVYQKGLRATGKLFDNLQDYYEVLEILKARFNVDFKVRMEEEFLSEDRMPAVMRRIISQRGEIGKVLSPSSGILAPRSPCPHEDCGLVDKYGIHNEYDEEHDNVHFHCPRHGKFSVSLATDCHHLQFNSQHFSLVFPRFYEDSPAGYIQISGSDYAGFWQEQMIWRHLAKPIIIVYCPLILDWSGNKLSKSIYLQQGGYQYLLDAKLGYMLSYKTFKEEGRDMNVLMDEVALWVDEPFRLFRGYSVHYLHLLFDHKHKIHLVVLTPAGGSPTAGSKGPWTDLDQFYADAEEEEEEEVSEGEEDEREDGEASTEGSEEEQEEEDISDREQPPR